MEEISSQFNGYSTDINQLSMIFDSTGTEEEEAIDFFSSTLYPFPDQFLDYGHQFDQIQFQQYPFDNQSLIDDVPLFGMSSSVFDDQLPLVPSLFNDIQCQDLNFNSKNRGIFCMDHDHDQPQVSVTQNSSTSNLEDTTFKVSKLSAEQRKEKIHRYMKKRNERNFSKKIKYACRKTLADSRPRVRGRFAKNDQFGSHEDDTSEDFGSSCGNGENDSFLWPTPISRVSSIGKDLDFFANQLGGENFQPSRKNKKTSSSYRDGEGDSFLWPTTIFHDPSITYGSAFVVENHIHPSKKIQKVVVKEEEDIVDCSDIFAPISGMNSFKCIYPIQSRI